MFFKESVFQNVVCQPSTILSRSHVWTGVGIIAWLPIHRCWQHGCQINMPADMNRSYHDGNSGGTVSRIFPTKIAKNPQFYAYKNILIQTRQNITRNFCYIEIPDITAVLHIFQTIDRTSCPNAEKFMGHGSWLSVLNSRSDRTCVLGRVAKIGQLKYE